MKVVGVGSSGFELEGTVVPGEESGETDEHLSERRMDAGREWRERKGRAGGELEFVRSGRKDEVQQLKGIGRLTHSK